MHEHKFHSQPIGSLLTGRKYKDTPHELSFQLPVYLKFELFQSVESVALVL